MNQYEVPADILILIFLTGIMLIILFRAFGRRNGHERKRNTDAKEPTVKEILDEMKKIIEQEDNKNKPK